MNRKIKFRGKACFNNQWIYGLLAIDVDWETCIEGQTYSHEVDKDTIGQYIGIKDCNGVEIYEGDIIKWYNDVYKRYIIAEIAWDDDDLGFSAKDARGFYIYIPKSTNIEIIGNIYDNPELLKE